MILPESKISMRMSARTLVAWGTRIELFSRRENRFLMEVGICNFQIHLRLFENEERSWVVVGAYVVKGK